MLCLLFVTAVLNCCLVISTAETFTSLAHLHQAISAQHDITTPLRKYIADERWRLKQLEILAENLDSYTLELQTGSLERHLSNPVNGYHVIKRMYESTQELDSLIDSNTNKEAFESDTKMHRESLPAKDDMDGAVLALLRIQDTYDLATEQLTNSKLGLANPADEAGPLNGDDCHKIGTTAFAMADYYHTVMWLQAGYEKYHDLAKTGINLTQQLISTLDHLNFALYKQGNIERALIAVNELLELSPGMNPGSDNKVYYEEILQQRETVLNPESLPPLENPRPLEGFHASDEFKSYELLCQGKPLPVELRPRKEAEILHCNNKFSPVMYAPIREEELSLNPRLVFLHQVLTDGEIEVIKSLARPKLDRSGVFAVGKDTPLGGIKTNTRVSKSAWVWDYEDERIPAISKKTANYAMLDLENAEALQVLNYGIGGHYEPHCDFARADNPNVFTTGNRIATFIMYLTDVELGGATAFPRLGAAVWPEKGGAAFWYNLLPNGEGDERTLHGACPVVAGYKWVSNKWFHEHGNEWIRPCGLSWDAQ